MIVKLLTGHHLEFLSLKGGCRGSSESTLVKMSNCWKSHATAQLVVKAFIDFSFQELMVQVCHFTYFLSYHNICFVIPDEGRDIVLTSSARPSVHIVCLS